MGKVFLAYKRVDRDRAMVVRAKLEALQVELFVDLKIRSGDNYIAAINDQLEEAAAVLVLWTEASVKLPKAGERNFVLGEADRGYNRNILVAATLDKIAQQNLPVPFSMVQAPDLSDWIEAGARASHAQWQNVLEVLGEKLGRPGLPRAATTIEDGSEIAKRTFLRTYKSDPAAIRIADELEEFERREFEKAMSAAQGRVTRRERETEKRLKAARDAFEISLQDMRAGLEYMPPDPVNLLNDNLTKLREQVEIDEAAIQDLESQLEQSQQALDGTNRELLALKADTARIQQERWPTSNKLTWGGAAGAVLLLAVGAFAGWGYSTQGTPREGVSIAAQLQVLQGRIKTYQDGEAQWKSREAEFLKNAAAAADLEKQRVDLARQSADVEERRRQVSIDQQAGTVREGRLNTKESEVAKREREAAAKERDLSAREQTLRGRETAVTSRETELSNARDDLARQRSELTVQEMALRTKADQLARDQQAQQAALAERERLIASREAELTRRNTELEGQLAALKKESDALESRRTATQMQEGPVVPPKPALGVDWVAQCDDLTAYRYDPDRPANSKWKENESEIGQHAQEVCGKALQGKLDLVAKRRVLAQIGRTYLAQGGRLNGSEAQKANQTAIAKWTEAGALGSGQAYVALAAYYMKTKEYPLVWENYKKAADYNNPVGQTHAAQILLFPEYFNKVVPANENEGRKYLDAAYASGIVYPRTLYTMGDAKRQGRGYEKDPDGGLALIEKAFCLGDSAAIDTFKRSKKHKAPTCQSSMLQ